MACQRLYAHSNPGFPEATWEQLQTHLSAVGGSAAEFAAAFAAAPLGMILGLFHDLGKAKPEFQAYLRGRQPSEPHAAAGAKWLHANYGPSLGRLLAFCIAGHHAGLANGAVRGGGLSSLDACLARE